MDVSLGLVYTIGILTIILAYVFAVYLAIWVKKQKNDNKTIERIAGLIREGAMTFMRKEYMILAAFSGVVAVLIFLFLPHPVWAVASFLSGVISFLAALVLFFKIGRAHV